MKGVLAITIVLSTGALVIGPVLAHGAQPDPNAPVQGQHHKPPEKPPTKPPTKPPSKPPVKPPVNRPPNRPPNQPPIIRPPNRPPTQPPVNRPPNRPPTQPPVIQPPNRPPQNWPVRRPRPGQEVIQPNRNWRQNWNHTYHRSTYFTINIWSPTTFGYGGRTLRWDPDSWQYYVEDSLVGLIYRSERMSNSLRETFERQMNRGGMQNLRGAMIAKDRIQRMDEGLEHLRASVGYFGQADLQESVIDVLSRAQEVSDSFYRYPNLRLIVRDDWEDLQFELSELARYYNVQGIR
jgi:hypothetical protein